jgi:lysine-N-methylase
VKTHYITMNYMEDFTCIGSDCEQNCCTGWNVDLKKEEAESLKHLIETHAALGESFADSIVTIGERNIIKMTPSGACSFQEDSGLCAIQSAAGEDALSITCAIYPRWVNQIGHRVELTAKTSCPELARQLLLKDNATEIVSCDKDLIPEIAQRRHIRKPRNHPWTRHLDDLRGLAMDFLKLPYPLAHRLYLLTEVARRVTAVLDQGTKKAPRKILQKTLKPLLQQENLDATHRHLSELSWDTGEVFAVPIELLALQSSLNGSHNHNMSQLLVDIWDADDLDKADIPAAAAKLWPLHSERRDKLHAQAGGRLEHYSERFAEHYWFHDLFPTHNNLNTYMIRLLMLMATQRILLINNPAIVALLDNDEPVPEALLDETAVRNLYNLTRNMEHSKQLDETLVALSPKESFPMVQKLCFI